MTRLAVLLCVGMSAVGCSSASPTATGLCPVRGTLLAADGKPAAGATVQLIPAAGPGGAAPPFGMVGADGAFTITTPGVGTGAAAGKYAVTVVWRSAVPDGEDGPTDKLKGRHADPARPLATVTVGPGETTLEPLRLK